MHRAKIKKQSIPQKEASKPAGANFELLGLKDRVRGAFLGEGGARGNRRVNKDGLNVQQELFCELYAKDVNCFGNGTQSYIKAYKINVGNDKKIGQVSYGTCRAVASELLTKPNILRRINQLLEADEEFINRQLMFLIMQNVDLRAKIRAIHVYNVMKGRIGGKNKQTPKKMIGAIKYLIRQ